MTEDARPAGVRVLPLLVLLFVGSGCAALIYEIVWFQLLELVIGSSAVSLGLLLGTFMGGMCLGSLLLPRLVPALYHPLRVYACLELAIAGFALFVLFAVPYGGRFYAAAVGFGLPGLLLRAIICGLLLLPPTLLMGATLPAMARWVKATPSGISWLGYLYGGNIAGAVLGCLVAGFFLLRLYDVATATYAAVLINLTVGLSALGLARLAPGGGAGREVHEGPARGIRLVYLAIALSGLCALGAEVVWTRLLSLMLGPTVYTFSLILAAFLIGLGFGASAGSLIARVTSRPRVALGVCQFLLAGAVGWAAWGISSTLPYLPVSTSLSPGPWYMFQLDLMRCLWVVLPAACLWGASFPLALASAASPGEDTGRLAGRVYAANTAGAIIGSVAFSLLLIPWLGTQHSQRVIIVLSGSAALAALAPLAKRLSTALPALGGLAAAGLMAVAVPAVPWEVIGYGRHMLNMRGFADPLYVGEGMNSSVAVSKMHSGARQFHVAGKVEASADLQDMRMERMLGHLPALVHSGARSALVVGCGAGITAGSFVTYPEIESIVICELEPLVPKVVAHYFARENYGVLGDRRTQVVYDDARHFVLSTSRRFDVITSDPIHPWVKGAATLYTREYFETCKRRLNPGGVVAQWVPLYESTLETVKSEIATFAAVFPGATIWSNHMGGPGYDVVLLGQAGPSRIDVGALEARLARADYSRVAASLAGVRFASVTSLLQTYAGSVRDLEAWLRGAQINEDRSLRLQYVAGMGVNVHGAELIFEDMLVHRPFPQDLFVVSGEQTKALREALGY